MLFDQVICPTVYSKYSKPLGLLITFANDQAQQNVESDLDPNCLTL